MTTIDAEALAKRAGHILFTQGPEQPAATARETCVLLDLLAAAEARATRAEAQSDIRGRAVAIYQQRARDAESERDEWRQTALDERGAALDALEQIKARDRRIQAVQHLVDQADHAGDWTVTCSRLQWAIDGTNPYRASETA